MRTPPCYTARIAPLPLHPDEAILTLTLRFPAGACKGEASCCIIEKQREQGAGPCAFCPAQVGRGGPSGRPRATTRVVPTGHLLRSERTGKQGWPITFYWWTTRRSCGAWWESCWRGGLCRHPGSRLRPGPPGVDRVAARRGAAGRDAPRWGRVFPAGGAAAGGERRAGAVPLRTGRG